MKKSVTIHAQANIALIKYWGKRDENLFLPTKSSLSVTLAPLTTVTTISLCSGSHEVLFDGIIQNLTTTRHQVIVFLDRLKKLLGLDAYFCIKTHNTFPTAAGLASSASGYAALVYGLNKLCDLKLSDQQLSGYARQGSGSACRSMYGGFVLWNKGVRADGSDSFAQPLFDQYHWPELRVLVAIVSHEEKSMSSRYAMNLAMHTSTFYSQWIEESEKNILLMIEAIRDKNFSLVGQLAQHDCLGMHQTMHTANPAFSMWKPETEKIIGRINQFREDGLECYFTIDAGPNVKILCLDKDVVLIKKELAELGCITEIIECVVGMGPVMVI